MQNNIQLKQYCNHRNLVKVFPFFCLPFYKGDMFDIIPDTAIRNVANYCRIAPKRF